MGLDLSKEEAFAMVRYPYSPALLLRREQAQVYNLLRLAKQEQFWESAGPVRAQTLSFLELPRELRDEIYRAIIPEHIALNTASFVPFVYARDDNEPDPEPESGWESKDELYKRCRRGLTDMRRRYPIFFTNRQVSIEALGLLYNERRFSFGQNGLHPREMVEILSSLPPEALTRIRHLRLDVWAFMFSMLAESEQQLPAWSKLFNFIVDRMELDSVTAELPFDKSFYRPEFHSRHYEGTERPVPQERIWDCQSRVYFWPAVRQLVNLLMAGQLKTLRLIHPLPVALQDVENLHSIQMLRIPRDPLLDEDAERSADKNVLYAANHQWFPEGQHVWKEQVYTLQGERGQHTFLVRREEGKESDGTTTLDLSRQ